MTAPLTDFAGMQWMLKVPDGNASGSQTSVITAGRRPGVDLENRIKLTPGTYMLWLDKDLLAANTWTSCYFREIGGTGEISVGTRDSNFSRRVTVPFDCYLSNYVTLEPGAVNRSLAYSVTLLRLAPLANAFMI